MSYKWAFAGIDRGGGKTVVIGDPARDKTPALLRALGHVIESLGGRYYAGADSGTDANDMRAIQEVTRFVRGTNPDHGDTSEATAYGVMQGIRAGVAHRLGRSELAGTTVAIQGVGHVGRHLATMLSARGASLIVADANSATAEQVQREIDATIVSPHEISSVDADVFAPCALGGVLGPETIDMLRAKVVCGAANNQLASDADADRLHARGVLFVPDYVVNSGGILNAMVEGRNFDRSVLWQRLDRIHDDCQTVFTNAAAHGTTTLLEANRLAERKMLDFAEARRVATSVS
jgi:leucine dehydrogenase